MQNITIKNIASTLLVLASYPLIAKEFTNLPTEALNTLTLFVGLIIIAPLFANFTFSYEETKKNIWLQHSITFLSMLLTGLLLVMLDILLVKIVGEVFSFRITLILFWFTIIAYDFWDFSRMKKW